MDKSNAWYLSIVFEYPPRFDGALVPKAELERLRDKLLSDSWSRQESVVRSSEFLRLLLSLQLLMFVPFNSVVSEFFTTVYVRSPC